ncbi:MAG: DUF885 domain-containing protein [Lachnospiraceae bacterium]|nr:DUF885 domain-containing protein [Lachnospiraceae bacterium]
MQKMNILKTKSLKKRTLGILLTFSILLLLGTFFYSQHHTSQTEDQRFENYTDQLFRQELSGNTLSLHYTLKNPATYNIVNSSVSLGTYQTDTSNLSASLENSLSLLHSYDKTKLSKRNQATYEILENHLSYSLKSSQYLLYEEPLASLTGAQAQLPILLSEYQFYTKQDVDTYLALLAETPEYFASILDFEEEKAKHGLFMSKPQADAIIDECETFINLQNNNFLYSSFEQRLQTLNLPKKEKDAYVEKNVDSIKQYVYPAYEQLMQGLHELKNSGTNSGGLCHLPEGDKYYELLTAIETGSSRSIPELQELTKKHIAEDLASIQKTLSSLSTETPSPSSDLFKSQGVVLEDSNPASILSSLRGNLSGHFPAPPNVNVQIKYVSQEMQNFLSPAFYLIPALDNTEENIIYINNGHISDDLSLYTTLAHEGYPGHLYQTTYFASKNPSPIRHLLDCGGYTEGWATYSEMLSYYFAPIKKTQATLMQKNSSILLGLYALADMGIHYDGWSLLDTTTFFRGYGITDTKAIEEIYQLILSDPANYLKYYIGYVEFLELKKEAMTLWGKEFTQERFHKAVLDMGPAPFDLIRKYIF